MNWASWNDFFAMGGYAFYVWGSYCVTLILMIIEMVLLMFRRRSLIGQLHRTLGARRGAQ
jgi:heme exporter protein D